MIHTGRVEGENHAPVTDTVRTEGLIKRIRRCSARITNREHARFTTPVRILTLSICTNVESESNHDYSSEPRCLEGSISVVMIPKSTPRRIEELIWFSHSWPKNIVQRIEAGKSIHERGLRSEDQSTRETCLQSG